MSRSTDADLVPFAVSVWSGSGMGHENPPLFVQLATVTEEYYDDFDLPDDFDGYINGWRQIENGSKDPARDGALYPSCWSKAASGAAVWAVNESEYSSGGAVELTMYAEKEEYLKEFLADMFPDIKKLNEECRTEYLGKIEKDAILTQTM